MEASIFLNSSEQKRLMLLYAVGAGHEGPPAPARHLLWPRTVARPSVGIVLRQTIDHRRRVHGACRRYDRHPRAAQHGESIGNTLRVELLGQQWMRVGQREDEAGPLGGADGLEHARWPAQPALDHDVVIVRAGRRAVGL